MTAMSTLSAERIDRGEANGPLKAEALLRRRANQKPGITALADPPNVEALGLGPPRSFNYHQADAAVDALAQFFIELGLLPGDIVAMQLPNLAHAPLTLLAAWRAGLTVAALPMLWRGHEIGKACDELALKALIGVSRGNDVIATSARAGADGASTTKSAATHASARAAAGVPFPVRRVIRWP